MTLTSKIYMIPNLISTFLQSNPTATILQIGGNDGIQDDFIKPILSEYNNVTLHTLEPIPQFYKELCNTYKDYKNVHCHNCAITTASGTDFINYIPFNHSMPIWLKGCSSFFTDKNIIDPYWQNICNDTNLTNYLKNNIIKLPVNTLTFNHFVTQQNINKIDILVIDTEGYECEILKQINLSQFTPHIIILEFHNHSDQDKNTITDILKSNNYTYNILPMDIVATKITT